MSLWRIGILFLVNNRHRLCIRVTCLYQRRYTMRQFLTSAASLQLHHPAPAERSDPYKLVEDDLATLHNDIRQELRTASKSLEALSMYGFDGHGKAIRPVITALMARAINTHLHHRNFVLASQLKMAVAIEMVHTASLMHDDVVDNSDVRRGRHSTNRLCGTRKAVLAGDYVLFVVSAMVSRLNNPHVVRVWARTYVDLVQGEFMQMGGFVAKDGSSFPSLIKERLTRYLTKTYKKTASLIACGCKSVAILGGADESLQEAAFQYGRHIGIAFQLVDDILDFTSSAKTMGKPAGVDLKLGLATAPVLFASLEHPHLSELIERRFQLPGDIETTLECVFKSDSIRQTRFLAQEHCEQAVKYASLLTDTPFQKGLVMITDAVLKRTK